MLWISSRAAAPCATPVNPVGKAYTGHPKAWSSKPKTDITKAAREIYLQAAITTAMPPANITYMTDEERQTIARSFQDMVN